MVNEAFWSPSSGNANLDVLKNSKHFEKKSDSKTVFKPVGKCPTTGWSSTVTARVPKDLDVNACFGHLLALLYYDWKAVYELMQRAQDPPPQPVVVQPPQQPALVAQ